MYGTTCGLIPLGQQRRAFRSASAACPVRQTGPPRSRGLTVRRGPIRINWRRTIAIAIPVALVATFVLSMPVKLFWREQIDSAVAAVAGSHRDVVSHWDDESGNDGFWTMYLLEHGVEDADRLCARWLDEARSRLFLEPPFGLWLIWDEGPVANRTAAYCGVPALIFWD